jgi:hypothetical protein
VHGGMKNYPRTSRAWQCHRIFEAYLPTSVNGMLAISGYIGVTSGGFNKRRPFYLWLSLVLYQNVIVRFGVYMKWNNIDAYWWIFKFTPISQTIWWFFTVYMFIMFLSPGLNHMACSLSKSSYVLVNVFLLAAEINTRRVGFFGHGNASGMVHGSIVYFLAGYFRLHGNPFHWRVLAWIWLLCMSYATDYVKTHSIDWLFPGAWALIRPGFTVYNGDFTGVTSILITLSLLLFWSTIPVRGSLGMHTYFVLDFWPHAT